MTHLRSTWILSMAVLKDPLVSCSRHAAGATSAITRSHMPTKATTIDCSAYSINDSGRRHLLRATQLAVQPLTPGSPMFVFQYMTQACQDRPAPAGQSTLKFLAPKSFTSKSFSFVLMSSVAELSSPRAPSTRGSRSSPSPATCASGSTANRGRAGERRQARGRERHS